MLPVGKKQRAAPRASASAWCSAVALTARSKYSRLESSLLLALTHARLVSVVPPPGESASITFTDAPRAARRHAMLVPIIPAPITRMRGFANVAWVITADAV
jgi:hypothetical protein